MKRKHIWKRFLTSVIALTMIFSAVPTCSGGSVFAAEEAGVETDVTETGTEEETKAGTETEEETESASETESETDTVEKEESGTVTASESGDGSTSATDSDGESYTVTLKQAEGGTLTLMNADDRLVEEDVYSYKEGETITVVIEDSEYLGFRLVMETSDGEVFADSWKDEYTARFTMPAEDVTIAVTYHEQTEEERAQDEKDEEMLSKEEESASVSLFSAISVLSSDSEYATYKKGKVIYYAGYNTRYRTLDGDEAYCLQPEYNGPANGTYLKRYNVEDYITVYSSASEEAKAELLRIAAYYSYGCPGFDKSMWPDTWYDGTDMTAARYYVLAHILLAELYTGSAAAALDGTVSAFQSYYREYVGGYYGLDKVDNYDDTTRGKISAIYHGDGITDAFVIYLVVNSGYQDILGWEYDDIGSVYVYKSAEDEDVCDDNDYYSLEGAVYGIYESKSDAESDSNRLATLTTTSSGKSDKVKMTEGTYYVKEVTASEGFDLDTETYEITVTGDKTTKVKSTEPMHTGKITVTKTASDSGVLNVSTTVKGAVYGIYDEDGTLVEEISTDSDGTATSGKLYFGDYTVKEISAPDGYWVDETEYEVSVKAEKTYSVSSTDEVKYGYIEIYKYSDNPDITDNNSCYSYGGAEYGIYSSDGDLVQTLTTVESSNGKYGYAKSDKLATGTYTVKEIAESEGFDLDTRTYSVSVTAGATSASPYVKTVESTEPSAYDSLTVTLTKIDSGTGESAAEGDVSLAGAQFTIKYYDTIDYDTIDELNAAIKSGKLEESDAWRTWVIETKKVSHINSSGDEETRYCAELSDEYLVSGSDELYYNSSGTEILPVGTIVIEETSAPEGYLLEGMSYTDENGEVTEGTVYFSRILQSDKMAQLTGGNEYEVSEVVIAGGVEIYKRDLQSGDALAEGGATLGGATFTITNLSEYAVLVDGTLYEPGEVVATLVTDDTGYASTASDLLPYGSYRIDESDEPAGYLAEGVLSQTFEIREDGVIVDMTGEQDSILNLVKRGDFAFTKADEDSQERLANCKFSVTSNTTGESHIIWTDANGYYSSESGFYAHSYNTNSGEPGAGLWFGLNEEGENVEVDDDMGALPYDTYTVQELECDANEGMSLVSFTVTITRDGYTVEMGTVSDPTVAISTSAEEEDSGTHYAVAGEDTILIDTVNYSGLVKGKTYTLVTKLMDKDTSTAITDENGKEISVTTEFTASMKNGSEDVEIIFDSTELSGHTIVIYEYLYDSAGELIASHADMADAKQTIYFPGIGTTAADEDTGIDVSYADEDVTVVDVVEYTNVKTGRTYTVNGTLYNQETGEPLTDASGNTITATTSFKAAESSGNVTLTFTFDGSLLAGTSVVAFETLERNNVIYAVHGVIRGDLHPSGNLQRLKEKYRR